MRTEQPDDAPRRAAAYCRVSTEEQKLRKNPTHTQRQVCVQAAEQAFGENCYTLEHFVDEGITGTVGEKEDSDGGQFRPEYTRMLAEIQAGNVDCVVCQSLDRLGRDEADLFRLREVLAAHGVKIRTPGREYDLNDPDDCLMFGLHAIVAAHQPRQTSVKIRAGKIQRKRRGLVSCSRPAFGWRLQVQGEYTDARERTIARVPEEAEVVVRIAQLYLAGHGYDTIARRLAEEGAPAPGPRGWYGSLIRTTLMNPVHCGLVKVQDDEYVRGQHFQERHYEPETYHDILREMERRADVRSYSAQGESFLVGTLCCGECGSSMSAKQGTRTRYYRCAGNQMDPLDACANVHRKADHVEQVVLNTVREYAMSGAVREPAAAKVAEILTADDQVLLERIGELENELEEVHRQVKWLTNKAASNPDLRDSFDENVDVRRQRSARVESELEQLRARQGEVDQRTRQWEEIRAILADFDAIWSEMDLAERRRVIRILFQEMTLSSTEGGSLLRMKPFFGEVQEVAIAAMNRRDRPKQGLQALTHRECEVLHLLGQGMTVTEIAEHFGITRGAVHAHRYKIHWKLGVDSDEEALRLSRELVTERLPFLELAGRRKHDPEPEELTETEFTLLPDLANPELLYKDIAKKHGIAEGTLKAHVHNMARRLRASGGRKNVLIKARRLGLLPET